METAKNIFILIQAIVGVVFSIYMMWGMFKVKKATDVISEGVTILGKEILDRNPSINDDTDYLPLDIHKQKVITPQGQLENSYFHKFVEGQKMIGVEWRSLGSTGGSVGIVLCQNSVGEITCRIGFVNDIEDDDPIETSKNIMLRGGKLMKQEALAFFNGYRFLIIEKWKDEML